MRIYLDHNATTPVRAEVAEAMARALRELPGNPSSTHAEGAAARAAVERAREAVAALLGCETGEVIFTAGASEANNAALALADRAGARVVSSTVEHPSVEEPLQRLAARGVEVTRIAVDAEGRLDEDAFERALGAGADLLSLIWANNETGVLQDAERLAARARETGALVHLDATQAVGKIPVDLAHLPAQLLSLSAHKLGGPKGVGCLIVRGDLAFEPYVAGGPQERRRRGGTENVPGIVGLGVACELAARELPVRGPRLAVLRDRLWEGIVAKLPGVRRNGSARHVLPNTLSVEFEGAAGDVLLEALDLEGVAASAGAACHSGSIEPSAVLRAMGRTPEQALGSLRFSVGHGNDEAQIDAVLARLPELVARVRRHVPA